MQWLHTVIVLYEHSRKDEFQSQTHLQDMIAPFSLYQIPFHLVHGGDVSDPQSGQIEGLSMRDLTLGNFGEHQNDALQIFPKL